LLGQTDPNGGSTAMQVTITGASGIIAEEVGDATYDDKSDIYANSCYVRVSPSNVTGDTFAASLVSPAGAYQPVTVTRDWQRFGMVSGAATTGVRFGFGVTGTAGTKIDFAFPQIEKVSGKSNPSPGPFVKFGAAGGAGAGVGAAPWNGANVDGVKYFSTTNGNRANLIADSEDFSAAAWTGSAVYDGLTTTANVTTAPDGTLTADKIAEDVNNNYHRTGQFVLGKTTANGRLSFYAKAAERTFARSWSFGSPTGFGQIVTYDLVSGVVAMGNPLLAATMESVGNGWWRCSQLVSDGSSYFVVGPATSGSTVEAPYVGTLGSGIYVWGAMLETGSTTRSYIKSGYVVDGSGTLIANATLRGYWTEQTVVNRALRSEEFDNAAWVKTNVTVAANSIAAPDGTLTADTLTASAANGTCIQDLGVVASAAKAGSIWLRRLTGTGNIQLTLNGGGAWTTVAVTSSWQRFFIYNNALANEDFGIRIVTSADAVYAWGGQVETLSAGCQAMSSSYIPTVAAGVTRNQDDLSFVATTNMPQTNWTVYFEAQRDANGGVLGGNSTPPVSQFNLGTYSADASVTLGMYGGGATPSAATVMLGAWPAVWSIGLNSSILVDNSIGIWRAAFTMAANGINCQNYLNGSVASGSAAPAKASNWNGAFIYIGNQAGGSGEGHGCTIRNVRIWDEVLPIGASGVPIAQGENAMVLTTTAIVPSDTGVLNFDGFYANSGGLVRYNDNAGTTQVINAEAGRIYDIRITRVWLNGTNARDIVGVTF
jgi:hypothetical protein